MIVLDSSAALATLTGRQRLESLATRLVEAELHAPHLIDVEVLHALRRLVRQGELSLERAFDARADFSMLAIVRYPHGLLSERAWALRDDLSAYDAMYVALAEALDVPLVTGDGRLATAPGHHALIELYEP